MSKNIKKIIAELQEARKTIETVEQFLEEQTSTAKAPEVVAEGTVAEDEDSEGRRAELEEMSYNDLKKIVKELGVKAVGKKPDLIEIILQEEGAVEGTGEEDDNNADEALDCLSALNDLELVELKDVAKELDIKVKSKATKKAIIQSIIDETEPSELVEVLEDLGIVESEEGEEGEVAGDDEEALDVEAILEEADLKTIKKVAELLDIKVTSKSKKDKLVDSILECEDDELISALEEAGLVEGEEGESEEGEEGEEPNTELVDSLNELPQEDLAEICAEYGLSVKGKKAVLVDRIVEAVEAGDIDEAELFEDDEEGESEEGSEDEVDVEQILADADLKTIKEVAELLDIKVTSKSKKDKLVEKILEAEDDELMEALEEAGLIDGEEGESEEVEVSEEVIEAEEALEADLRKKYKSKKLKDATMKKFLSKYYEGDPDCKDCKGCSKEELLECYIKAMRNFVSDDCEVMGEEEPYERGEVTFCCGKPLTEDEDGNLVCEVCGGEYEAE